MAPRTWAHDGIEPLHIDESVQFNEGIALQKDSEFTALFDHHIFELLQTGVVDRIRYKLTGIMAKLWNVIVDVLSLTAPAKQIVKAATQPNNSFLL